MTTEIAGLDFSDTKPDAHRLVDAGFRFVLGYLKPLVAPGVANGKELDAAHLAGYRAAGLEVGMFYETTANRALSGAAGGAADGAVAIARAKAVGYPVGSVIIAAVDFDAGPAQLPAVLNYVLAFDSVVTAAGYPGGGYGGLAVVEALAAARPSLYLAQTAAWSGGRLSPHAHLYQRAKPTNWPAFAGTDEEVKCRPLPLAGANVPAPTPPQPHPVPPRPPAPSFDGTAWVKLWRARRGQTGAVFVHLQNWGNGTFPAYCHISPAPVYGPATQNFLREFAHRASADPSYPGHHGDLRAADGANIGNDLSAALAHYRFGHYLERVGFRG